MSSYETKIIQLVDLHNDVVTNGKFDVFHHFNNTSVLFLLYSCSGIYGEDYKKLSLDVMKQLILWTKKNKWELYLSTSSSELKFHSKILEDAVNLCETYTFRQDNENESDENNPQTNNDRLINNNLACNICERNIENDLNMFKFTRNVFIGIFTGALVLKYLMSPSSAPTST